MLKEEFEQIVKDKLNIPKESIHGDIQLFETWFNPNCAIVISKLKFYAVRLIIYEPPVLGQKKEFLFIKRFPNSNVLSGYKTPKDAEDRVNGIKEKLNSDNPILAVAEGDSFSLSKVIEEIRLEIDENLEKNLKEFDII